MWEDPGRDAICLGLVLIVIPFLYSVVGGYIANKIGTTITIITLRSCSKVVIAGIFLIFLGFLYLMGVINWLTTLR